MDAEGNQRHVKDADAKLVEREKEGVHPGKIMAILAGTHAGLMCQVLALEPKASFRIPRMCRSCLPLGAASGHVKTAMHMGS